MSNRSSQGAQNIRNSLRKRITSLEDFLAEQDRELLSAVREGYYDGPDSTNMDELIARLRTLPTSPDEPIYYELRKQLEQISALLKQRWEKTKESAVKGNEAAQKIQSALDKYYRRRGMLKAEIESYSRVPNSSQTTDIINEKRTELSKLELLIEELESHRDQFADLVETA